MHNAGNDDVSASRRHFLKGAAACGALAVAGGIAPLRAESPPLLTVGSRTLDINGKAARVFSILGPGGKPGVLASEGEAFAAMVRNATADPLALHWHGQVLAPNTQDRARPATGPLAAGAGEAVAFPLTPGTHWMHSHSLTEQLLLAAPMIAREKDAGEVQEVVVMLHDFSFRTPEEIMAGLGGAPAHGSAHGRHGSGMGPEASRAPMRGGEHSRHGGQQSMPGGHHMGMGSGTGIGMGSHMGTGTGMGSHMGMGMMMGTPHANDVAYDAYLANDRTLRDPEVVRVEKASRVRLRIINGGTATAFFISTGALRSRCIAVDGSPCSPAEAAAYPLAQGQRIDLLVDIPAAGGAFPILAEVEADRRRTGLILATAGAGVSRIAEIAAEAAPHTDLSFEAGLRAMRPLPDRQPDRSYLLMLGEEPGYRWTINGRVHGEHDPLQARLNERVELTFMNPTAMMHPMHLHGHHFQVVAIGGQRFSGPVRDTVIVPPHTPVTVAFDASSRGEWFLHCHHLYHMATGMMTELRIA